MSESGVVSYDCDSCQFSTTDPREAAAHEILMNRHVRNAYWRCGADLSDLTSEQEYSHLDRCYGKDEQ